MRTGTTGGVRVQQTRDKGASSRADVRWDAIFIALDFLVRVL